MRFPIYFCRILTFGKLQKNVITCSFRGVVKIIQNESFFCYLGFLSQTFTIHMAAGKGGGYLFNSSLLLPDVDSRVGHQHYDVINNEIAI